MLVALRLEDSLLMQSAVVLRYQGAVMHAQLVMQHLHARACAVWLLIFEGSSICLCCTALHCRAWHECASDMWHRAAWSHLKLTMFLLLCVQVGSQGLKRRMKTMLLPL